ncbi:MAG TPA: AMP-binding protein [Leptospiraceae bacterium]|nr:AMP-binding protein [Leptospiraceae bacterium]HMW07887.1 AMP-binding protein [Leptospiraceae bacterium]HMX33774.1 AMP-binding protein [Leptospiraceae bacterium]HMY31150.1 AMP-binding protein [Leptospiraceae bacterium]HMZ66667.1 AMP-binding protein [Leptospiraceae bacterium]
MNNKISPKKNTLFEFMKDARTKNANIVAQMFRTGSPSLQSITFQEVYEKIQLIAFGLIKLGTKKGDKVGLVADSGHRFMWLAMGITNIGAVDVPRGTDATSEDLLYIFNHASCKIIILENVKAYEKIQKSLSKLSDLKYIIFYSDPGKIKTPSKVEVLTLDALMELGEKYRKTKPDAFEKMGEAIDPKDLATIIYTSGTTGTPKGVMLSHNNYVWMSTKLEEALRATGLELQGDETTLGYLPPWHIGDRLFESTCLGIGVTMAFTNIANLASDLKTVNPTLMFSVPRVWESFYNKILENVKNAPPLRKALFNLASSAAMNYTHNRDYLRGSALIIEPESFTKTLINKTKSLFLTLLLFIPYQLSKVILSKVKAALGNRIRFAFSGAGALPYHIDRFFYSIGLPILETYGMSETTGVSCMRDVARPVIGTLGNNLSEIGLKLIDEKGNEITKPNVKGVAYHKGQHIMMGYYKDPEKTKAVLSPDGWMNSGDILIRTASGQLKFAGRAKDTIVLLGGENLEPEPIEFALVQSEFIHQAMVVGQDKKTLGALIVPAFDKVEKHFKSQNIALPANREDWKTDQKILNLFKNEIKTLVSNEKGFKAFEKVTGFAIITKEFEAGKELTQTLKLRRNVMFEMYAKEIEGIYK